MKKKMNLRYSREKQFIKKRWQKKTKKSLPMLIPLTGIFLVTMIVFLMNLQCLTAIKRLDEQLNENKKLEEIFLNLEGKKSLVESRKEIISFLEEKDSLAYQVMEKLQMALPEKTKLMKVDFKDGEITIVGRSENQNDVKEFCENLDKISGVSQTKINHVYNLHSNDNLSAEKKAPDLIWEFLLESKIREAE